MIILIDNYDSFTYNLYQDLALLNKVEVFRNDAITLDEISSLNPQGIVLSPGPGHPKDAGICIDLVKRLGNKIPVLGVCLGHQAISIAFGGKVIRAIKPVHGKSSLVTHNNSQLFHQLSLPFVAGRYHSLIVEKASLPAELIIDAWDEQGNIMAMSHREYPIYGVQFHPESILSPEGKRLLTNFVELCNVKSLY
jgi:anthranilate synthase component 2